MKKRRVEIFIAIIFFSIVFDPNQSFGSAKECICDSINVTLNEKMVIEKGQILSRKIKVKGESIIIRKGSNISQIKGDSLSLIFDGFVIPICIEEAKNLKLESISIFKGRFKLTEWNIRDIFHYISYNWIHRSYGVAYHFPGWTIVVCVPKTDFKD